MHIDTDAAGIELAKPLDRITLYKEGNAENGLDTLLPEMLTAFKVQFEENQQHIQHRILDGAFTQILEESRYDDPSVTQEELVEEACELANDVLWAYTNELAPEGERVTYSDLPTAASGYFTFRDAIVDGFYRDTVMDTLDRVSQDGDGAR
jgi:hypothetical protein